MPGSQVYNSLNFMGKSKRETGLNAVGVPLAKKAVSRAHPKRRDPRTPAEWQEAVDAAIDVERCDDMR